MGNHAAVWMVIAVALAAANLPFLSERLFGLWPLPAGKPMFWRLGELVLLYGATGVLAHFLERQAGQAAPQGWAFYAVTGAVFLTLAFPGFVWRYLVRRPRGAME